MNENLAKELILPEAIDRLVRGKDLTREESRQAIGEIMSGRATPATIAAFLVALRMKGETVDEIAGAAKAMREAADVVATARHPVVDTCGTGGDGKGTVNISTAAALVACGGGANVAKHGNRAVSSKSGSADVLEALGVRIDLDSDQMSRCLDDVGIAFLFAPTLHPAMKHAIGPRRDIRIRTLFNILGPLTNPAGADRQLLGVFSLKLAPVLASVLGELGSAHSLVVHSLSGEDELSVHGENLAVEIRRDVGEPQEISVRPADLGLSPGNPADLSGDTAVENARWLSGILDGSVTDSSRDAVILNAAAALYVAGVASDLKDGCARARVSIDSDSALKSLNDLRDFTNRI